MDKPSEPIQGPAKPINGLPPPLDPPLRAAARWIRCSVVLDWRWYGGGRYHWVRYAAARSVARVAAPCSPRAITALPHPRGRAPGHRGVGAWANCLARSGSPWASASVWPAGRRTPHHRGRIRPPHRPGRSDPRHPFSRPRLRHPTGRPRWRLQGRERRKRGAVAGEREEGEARRR